MSFCGVNLEELCAALNALMARNPGVDVEQLKPADLLKIAKTEFSNTFQTTDKDDVLAQKLFDYMSENYRMTKHSKIFSAKQIKKVQLFDGHIMCLVDWKGMPESKDQIEHYTHLMYSSSQHLNEYLLKNLDTFLALFAQVSPKLQKQYAHFFAHDNYIEKYLPILVEQKPSKIIHGEEKFSVSKIQLAGDKKTVKVFYSNNDVLDVKTQHAVKNVEIAQFIAKELLQVK